MSTKRKRGDFDFHAEANRPRNYFKMEKKMSDRRRKSYRQGTRKKPAWAQILHIKTLGGLPPRARLRMGYASTFVMGNATDNDAIQVFRLNSVWDPDYTGTGVTCTGYSTLADLYGRYFVHGSTVLVEASIRDASATTVNAANCVLGCSVSDYVPIRPGLGNYDGELELERFRLEHMPRGTSQGGLYRMNHTLVSRGVNGTGYNTLGQAGHTRPRFRNMQGGAFTFRDRRGYKLHDPLATNEVGGLIEHEQEGQYPLTGAIGGNPQDNIFLGCWGFSTGQNNAALQPLPYVYWTVRIVMDVEWYSPFNGVAPPISAAAGGPGSGDTDETQPTVA